MVSKIIVIRNSSGLHLRPAGVLRKRTLRYKSKISFKVCTIMANAKGVLNVLEAYMKSGDEIEFICEGPDEEETLGAMVGTVGVGLGEQIDGSQRLRV